MKTTLELLRERLLKDKEIFPHYNEYINGILYDIDNELLAMEKEQKIAFGKKCFYKGFEKAENDDANCFTAWREEAPELLTFKSE